MSSAIIVITVKMNRGKRMAERIRREQLSLLSGQLEMMVCNNMGNAAGDRQIIQTAKRIKHLMEETGNELKAEEVEKFIDTLTKAKVKSVMSNNSNYYNICVKLDAIISNIKKHYRGVEA